MAARELKRITDHVTCPVCLQTYKDPKMLPCQHTYCQQCLYSIVERNKVTCPECRKVADVPPGGVKNFPSNLTINHLIDDFFLRRQNRGKVNCEACIEEDPVTSFCFTCSMFMCQTCQAFHKRGKDTHQHVIVYLEKPNQPKAAQIQKMLPNCPDHDLELKFYCDTCERLVCVYCTMNEHVKHSHGAVKKMAAKHREQLKKITAPLNDMITKLLQAHNDIADAKKKLLKQHETVDKDIDQFFDNVIQKVEQQRQQLKQELHKKVSSLETLLISQLKEVESVQAHVISVNELASEVEESCDDEMLSREKQLVNYFNKVNHTYTKLQIDSVKPGLHFIPSNIDEFPQFGHLSGLSHVPKRDYSTMPKLHKFINIDGKMGEVQGIAFSLNHHWAITDFGNNCVYIYNEQDQLVKQIGSRGRDAGKFSNPFGVAFDDNNFLYVVDWNNSTVQKFDFTGQYILQFRVKIDPTGIAVHHDKVYIGNHKNQCISVYQTDGTFCFSFGSYGKGPRQFSNPWGVATTPDNTLLVVDAGNARIQTFQLDGTFIQMFGTKGSQKGQLNWPAFVAIDPTGNILVTECTNNRVSVFDKTTTTSTHLAPMELVTISLTHHMVLLLLLMGRSTFVILEIKEL